jgi:dihydropteroate synthase
MTKIVGILNVTPDSFSDGGKFSSLESALAHAQEMILEGAGVIDIGAESTRPQATPIGAEEEWSRLEKILPAVVALAKPQGIQTSIDSYHFETIQKAQEIGVEIINDVSGLIDKKIVEFVAAKNISVILMHNPIHANPDLIVNQHLNITQEILAWASIKISALEKKNVRKSQLIFDPGIGFAKNAEQSIRILKNIDAYRILGLPLYIGHSKKSFLNALNIPGDRAEKTLEISKFLVEKNVEFLRVHDVKAHRDLIASSTFS